MRSEAVLELGAETGITEREREREREHCYAVWGRVVGGVIWCMDQTCRLG